MLIITYLIPLLLVTTSCFKSQVYRSNGNLLLYDSSTGLNKEIFVQQRTNQICALEKQFFTKFQETFSIRSRQGFFNVEAVSYNRDTLVTGIGTAKYDPELDQYESKVKILTHCRDDNVPFVSYTLILKLVSLNETTAIEIPVALSCFPEASSIKVEYIVLQFIVGIVFILFIMVFSNVSKHHCTIRYQPIHMILFLTLPILRLPLGFTFYVSLVIVHKFFRTSLTCAKVLKLVLASLIIIFSLIWLEMNVSLYIHYIFNMLTVFVGVIVFKPIRFRFLVLFLLIGVYLMSYYKQLIGDGIATQIILPAMIRNEEYACVYFSIHNILLPLIPSIFIARSFQKSPQIKNVHVLLHFVIFLGIGLFEALSKMGGVKVKSMSETIAVLIVISSCFVALVQGNLRKLVTFRETVEDIDLN